VDTRTEIREFLTSRRAKITPDQVGLTAYGPRRVPGLRREEVAVLAGVSVPYYTRLERGDMSGVSESVLEALARALQLDDAERAHLFDLARAAGPMAKRRRRSTPKQIRPSVQRVLDAMTARPRSSRTAAWTPLPPTSLDAPCTQSCSATRPARPTTPASRF
jgi:transcriptional regulator with XRE-family HTH domain